MLLYCIISFFSGCLLTYLFIKFVKIDVNVKLKKNIPHYVSTKPKPKMPTEIENIQEFLDFIKTTKTVPLRINPSISSSLLEIAKTQDWHKKLDAETIKNLQKMALRWKNSQKKYKDVKVSESTGGFHETKYWSGTRAEFLQAQLDGIIDEYTEVDITDEEYHGSWISIKDNGDIEEYYE